MMTTTKKTSQVHEAYLAIENRIVTLEFVPGSKLTERFIIDSVGFGRTPVREAIQRLMLEGLIEVHPRSGVKIVDIRPEDYPLVMEPRLSLEPLLARSAARFGGPRDRELIAHCMHEMHTAARRGDVRGYLRQDKALDEALSKAAANPYLPRALAPLQTHSRRFWFHYHGTNGLVEAAAGHVAVCQEVIIGDSDAAFDKARLLMEYLFNGSRARVVVGNG